MNRRNEEPKTQRISRAKRFLNMVGRSVKSGSLVSSSKTKSVDHCAASTLKTGKDSRVGACRVRASDVLKALDEIDKATTVDDVLSSAGRAKKILRMYRDCQKTSK
jgi:hypothetical protein